MKKLLYTFLFFSLIFYTIPFYSNVQGVTQMNIMRTPYTSASQVSIQPENALLTLIIMVIPVLGFTLFATYIISRRESK